MTGGLTASVGVGSSKFIAKVASELDKPDGVDRGPARAPSRTCCVRCRPASSPASGPATTERLRRAGIHTVAQLEAVSEDELVRLLGRALGTGLHALARGRDDRPVVAEREAKSVTMEDTYDTDLTDRRLMEGLITRQASSVAARLAKQGLSGRTVTLKVRLHDFTTLSRSSTLPGPTDSPQVIGRLARRLLADLDTSGGVRLLGVGVSGLADWIQDGSLRRRPGGARDTGGGGRHRASRGHGTTPARGRVAPRHGRGARRPRAGLGVGLGTRGGDRPVRDRRDTSRARSAPSARTTRC